MTGRVPPSDAQKRRTHTLAPCGRAACGRGTVFSDEPTCDKCRNAGRRASTARLAIGAMRATEPIDEEG